MKRLLSLLLFGIAGLSAFGELGGDLAWKGGKLTDWRVTGGEPDGYVVRLPETSGRGLPRCVKQSSAELTE